MVKGLYYSAYSMLPRMSLQDSIANNLANVSTPGYKKESLFVNLPITTQNAFDHALGQRGAENSTTHLIDFAQGTFEPTGDQFDLALNGEGFFKVLDDSGRIVYTRNGQFMPDGQGMLVNNLGYYLLDDNNTPITITEGDLRILANGEITIDGNTSATIGIADFAPADYPSLMPVGNGLFEKPAAVNEIAAGDTTSVLAGYLEQSNVEPVTEMVDMIERMFRRYETGQKCIHALDETLRLTVSDVGRIQR